MCASLRVIGLNRTYLGELEFTVVQWLGGINIVHMGGGWDSYSEIGWRAIVRLQGTEPRLHE